MADSLGIRIGVEGEKEFKNALRDINTTCKTLATKMKAVTSAFDSNDKSVTAMTARNKTLEKKH